MSPEQAEGRPVDQRSDIFSLGIVLYEMASGDRPFRGETKMSLMSSIIKDHPAPITEVRTRLPRQLGRIIGRTLEKQPTRRFQTALDLRVELEKAFDERCPETVYLKIEPLLDAVREDTRFDELVGRMGFPS